MRWRWIANADAMRSKIDTATWNLGFSDQSWGILSHLIRLTRTNRQFLRGWGQQTLRLMCLCVHEFVTPTSPGLTVVIRDTRLYWTEYWSGMEEAYTIPAKRTFDPTYQHFRIKNGAVFILWGADRRREIVLLMPMPIHIPWQDKAVPNNWSQIVSKYPIPNIRIYILMGMAKQWTIIKCSSPNGVSQNSVLSTI